MKVQEIDTAEYDAIKDKAVDMSQDQLLDEFAHLTIRENELEGQVKQLNSTVDYLQKINDMQVKKISFILGMVPDELRDRIEVAYRNRAT
jgi:Asp-tRNA(Asn)/Glu-tRNA(Gln) amidotransferase C subunit|tara:strand:- start:507 stop:776 length:270 start_codon:yes stop_codon:yes gene_type:complete